MELNEDSRLDSALRMGLAKDPAKLSYYRKAASDPRKAVKDPVLRPYVAEMAESLIRMAVTDPILWTRLRSILTKHQFHEEVEQEETRSTLSTIQRVLRERADV